MIEQVEVPCVTLETAWVGARVYSYAIARWGTINYLNNHNSAYPINVEFDNEDSECFTSLGRRSNLYANPDLFWGVPTITAPHRPRRKVKKTFWQNVYSGVINSCGFFTGGGLYTSEAEALRHISEVEVYVATTSFEVEVDE